MFTFFEKCVGLSSQPSCQMQRMIGSMKLTAAIAIILAIATCVVKETRPDLVVLNRTATIMNTCWNGAGLAILMLIYVRWGWRVVASRWANMYWSDRRWKAVVVRHPLPTLTPSHERSLPAQNSEPCSCTEQVIFECIGHYKQPFSVETTKLMSTLLASHLQLT